MYYRLDSDNYPIEKPFRLRLADGLTLTNPTEEELVAQGWRQAPEQPRLTYPERLDWINHTWVIRDPNEAEIEEEWFSVRQRCQQLLLASDYKVIKATELAAVKGTTLAQELDPAVVAYRQALRDLYNNVNNVSPFFVDWPTLQ